MAAFLADFLQGFQTVCHKTRHTTSTSVTPAAASILSVGSV